MEEQEIGRHLDLVSKLKLRKLAKEVSESDNQLAKELLVYVDKLNTVLDTKVHSNGEDAYEDDNDRDYTEPDVTAYNYRTFD